MCSLPAGLDSKHCPIARCKYTSRSGNQGLRNACPIRQVIMRSLCVNHVETGQIALDVRENQQMFIKYFRPVCAAIGTAHERERIYNATSVLLVGMLRLLQITIAIAYYDSYLGNVWNSILRYAGGSAAILRYSNTIATATPPWHTSRPTTMNQAAP